MLGKKDSIYPNGSKHVASRIIILSRENEIVTAHFNLAPWEDLKAFDYWRFIENVDKALDSVRAVLDHTRNPLLAEHVPHVYQDKYSLVEFVTNTAVAAYVLALESLGLTGSALATVLDWTHRHNSPVTLRFQTSLTCDYIGEEEVKVVLAEREVETRSSMLPTLTELTKVKRTVKQYSWHVRLSYNLTVWNRDRDSVTLQQGQTTQTFLTSVKKSPLDSEPEASDRTCDLPLTWLLQNVAPLDGRESTFRIDRLDLRCKTPRRNVDVENAADFDRRLHQWASQVSEFFADAVDAVLRERHKPVMSDGEPSTRLDASIGDSILVPILPVFDNGTALVNDTETLLREQAVSIKKALDRVSKVYETKTEQSRDTLITVSEASLAVIGRHLRKIAQQHSDAVNYVEYVLYEQLTAAIGKHVQAQDFEDFMRMHFRGFFGPDIHYEPFAHSIRQPDHYPDGVLSIESTTDAEQNIMTLVRRIPGELNDPIRLPINSATSLKLAGDRYLHGWLQHGVVTDEPHKFQLAARARQFSSFLLVLGTVTRPDEFTPKHAIILRNKDEILIPLLTEALPSAKAFRDAIESLSLEQQEFARAFRAMQLQASVFGVCVIQLKPQLERLLNLPPGALTKEIELTEDLMSLFVDYQIPSDLLSYDEIDLSAKNTTADKLGVVKSHVANVMKVIRNKKEQELENERLKTDMRAEKASARDKVETSKIESIKLQWTTIGEPDRGRARGLSMASYATHVDRTTEAAGGSEAEGTFFSMKKIDSLDDIIEAPSETSQGTQYQSDSQARTLDRDDFTLLPKSLDQSLEKYDLEGSLRSVIIRPETSWTLKSQETLLSPMSSMHFDRDSIDAERKKAFDLLDAISRSGALPIVSSELHAFIAVSHCFKKSIMDTILQDNANPIVQVEKSMLLLGSTIFGVAPPKLLSHDANTLDRMKVALPALFVGDSDFRTSSA